MTIEEAIKVLSYIADEMPSMECADWKEAISMAIKALKQEPFINKACVSTNACKHDKEIALNKIKAEIKHNSELFTNKDGEDCLAIYEDDVIEIIDKYAE